MNQTMHSPVTTALAQTIYNLSDSDFNRLLNQSTYLKQLGNLCSIGIYLISIGCAIACFQGLRNVFSVNSPNLCRQPFR